MYADGEMHGAGTYYIPADEAMYEIEFVKGNPCGMGTLVEGAQRSKELFEVDFDGNGSFAQGVQPVKKIKSRRTDPKEALLPVCGMLAGPKGGPLGYDHCAPVSGELIWARPPRCDCMLFNAAMPNNASTNCGQSSNAGMPVLCRAYRGCCLDIGRFGTRKDCEGHPSQKQWDTNQRSQ